MLEINLAQAGRWRSIVEHMAKMSTAAATMHFVARHAECGVGRLLDRLVQRLPEAWPTAGTRRRAGDGSEYELRSRAVSVDPLDQSVLLELRAEKRRDGVLVAAEEHPLTMRGYLRDELLLMLDRAGFHSVDVRGDYTGEAPTPDHEFLVYRALR